MSGLLSEEPASFWSGPVKIVRYARDLQGYVTSRHAEAQIRPHHCDIARRLIRQRVMYKLCTIVYKCLHAAAPPYLSELCIPVSTSAGRHFLRSATCGDLLVPTTSTSTYGPRSFAVSGPSVWNKLPATLRVSPTLGQFQSKLKAVLFRSVYET